MSDLKTNYKNDVLDITMDGKRRYEQVENSDGTVSLVDKTVYTQLGDNLGADDINAQNTAINTLNNNLGQFQFRETDGKPQYKLESEGADAWRFFNGFNFVAPTIVDNRVTHLDGGYIVKDGVCYINWYFETNVSLGAKWGIADYMPNMLWGGTDDLFPLMDITDGTNYYSRWVISCQSNSIITRETKAQGLKVRVVGSYPTDASDT